MDGEIMNAKVIALWMLVECPECHRPQVVHKHVIDNLVVHLLKTRYVNCDNCDNSYFIELKENDFALS
jgi:ribosomal protein S27E